MKLERRHVDTIYETMSAMNVVAHLMTSEGVETNLTGDASYLLMEASKRLGRVADALERLTVDADKLEIVSIAGRAA